MKGLISILQSSSAAEEDYWFEMRPDVREGWGGVLGLGFLRSETGIGRVLERSYVTAYQNLWTEHRTDMDVQKISALMVMVMVMLMLYFPYSQAQGTDVSLLFIIDKK